MNDSDTIYDLLIIGGGINGCGIARDASGRGLSVYLCEQFDLANETSSRSTKLIHGGLRYLEHYEFRLVREALAERDVLLKIAPHIIQPLQFIIPHNKLQRPTWLIRLGLFLYDHLGVRFGHRSQIPKSKHVKLTRTNLFGAPLHASLTKGFSYYDCKVDDARLVVINAVSAQKYNAIIKTRTQFISAKRDHGIWISTLIDRHTQEKITVHSRALINAAGPWVDQVIIHDLQLSSQSHVELVKGSHIVIPRYYTGEQAYLLQNDDQRIVFVIPYHEKFTMIGTTDVPYHGDPATVKISAEERDYLCQVVDCYFNKTIKPDDIVSEWSGVRPLQADEKNNPSAVTRDYKLEVDDIQGQAPLLSIFGGKITTYRKLAEHALEKLKPYFPTMKGNWTAAECLPGGDFAQNDLIEFTQQLQNKYPYLSKAMLARYAHSYGTLSYKILEHVAHREDLGEDFGAGLYAREVDYLIRHEWAETVEDILWRRTKLGLFKNQIDLKALEKHITL
ncbi:MAG: glycerol-3-phosphate dehydrogenase [Gammaproteobacteria bacterium]|nr:glycerol-3-phosphate dehydrogenase [Gammaproteobacteria bacterium]